MSDFKFLDRVKVTAFAVKKKMDGSGFRSVNKVDVDTVPNKEKEKVFTVVGSTHMNIGETVHEIDVGLQFQTKSRQHVYLVANSLGRMFKVKPSDLVKVNETK